MIQGGLLNDPKHVDDLNMFVMQLLRSALDDPGVPNPREVSNCVHEHTDTHTHTSSSNEVVGGCGF